MLLHESMYRLSQVALAAWPIPTRPLARQVPISEDEELSMISGMDESRCLCPPSIRSLHIPLWPSQLHLPSGAQADAQPPQWGHDMLRPLLGLLAAHSHSLRESWTLRLLSATRLS